MPLKVQIVLMKVALSNVPRIEYVCVDDVDQWNILKVHSKLGSNRCTYNFDVVIDAVNVYF